jgi:hypothetical protein
VRTPQAIPVSKIARKSLTKRSRPRCSSQAEDSIVSSAPSVFLRACRTREKMTEYERDRTSSCLVLQWSRLIYQINGSAHDQEGGTDRQSFLRCHQLKPSSRRRPNHWQPARSFLIRLRPRPQRTVTAALVQCRGRFGPLVDYPDGRIESGSYSARSNRHPYDKRKPPRAALGRRGGDFPVGKDSITLPSTHQFLGQALVPKMANL